MRRKDTAVASLPEDGHHSPSEAPEALLLAVREREAAAAEAAAGGAGQPARKKAERLLRLPGTELTLTPELVAISMGARAAHASRPRLACMEAAANGRKQAAAGCAVDAEAARAHGIALAFMLVCSPHMPPACSKPRARALTCAVCCLLHILLALPAPPAVYFVQGILGLSRLALSFFFKDDLGVEPAQV